MNWLEGYRRGVGFRAEVEGTILYWVRLRFAEGDWDGECSCPVGFDCKHCCAVALQVLGNAFEPAEVAEDGPRAVSPAVMPGATIERAPDAKVALLFAHRLGRKLTAEEKRAADAVDHLFESDREADRLAESVLEPITRSGAARSYHPVQLWPREPRTPWEAWLYIASYLRRNHKSCPPALLEATDWAEVEPTVHAGETGEERWRTRHFGDV